ncbi:MAG: AAA family ATPase, partial [bacterium]|nr:AAA family ATPase [bacterium]
AKRILRAKVLVIDEVSMLGAYMIDMVDAVTKAVKGNERPFGGMQIIFVGDFFQLPPVNRDREKISFAYDSIAWAAAEPVACYLTEQHRQDDDAFLSVLTAIRKNTFNDDHAAHIENRRVARNTVPDTVPRLFSHNADVDSTNDAILAKLEGEAKVFNMVTRGPAAMVAGLQKGCLSPQFLKLKKGAVVMFTKNNPQEHFVNGTLGTVQDFTGAGGAPVIKTRDGRRIEAEPMDWAIEENGKERARISQLPLRLAWAMTVHKSQGVSLDEAVMDLSDVFEFGQGYVALSRVKRLSGLHLLGWNERAFQVHPEVFEKDIAFRAGSDEADALFNAMDATRLKDLHANFIASAGGKEIPEREKEDASAEGMEERPIDKLRKESPQAFRRWTDEEEKKLKDLFKRDAGIPELAKLLGRKEGGIRARLEKLGLIEPLYQHYKKPTE